MYNAYITNSYIMSSEFRSYKVHRDLMWLVIVLQREISTMHISIFSN